MRLPFSRFPFATRLTLRPARAAFVATALALGVAGCTSFNDGPQQRGYILDEEILAQVKPGMDVQQVLTLMGTPSTVSTVGNRTFYYISQTTEQTFRFVNPKVTDQRVVAIYFNNAFKVERIANYGLKDGVVFDFISRTTPTGGAEQSFVRNLFRGMTRFNPFGA